MLDLRAHLGEVLPQVLVILELALLSDLLLMFQLTLWLILHVLNERNESLGSVSKLDQDVFFCAFRRLSKERLGGLNFSCAQAAAESIWFTSCISILCCLEDSLLRCQVFVVIRLFGIKLFDLFIIFNLLFADFFDCLIVFTQVYRPDNLSKVHTELFSIVCSIIFLYLAIGPSLCLVRHNLFETPHIVNHFHIALQVNKLRSLIFKKNDVVLEDLINIWLWQS